MTKTEIKNCRSEKGFTLVELAIVMIIIGLLIGGVLKGQELIANAQVTSTIAQIKSFDAAVSTFRDQYSALPGDMLRPDERLSGCDAAPCNTAGDGSGRIDVPGDPGTAPGDDEEGTIAFLHLSAADLITGIQSDGTAVYGEALPEADIGGGYWIGFSSDGTAGGIDTLRPGHYLTMSGTVDNVGADTGSMNPSQAARLDRKIDDGTSNTGDVQVDGGTCDDGAGVYEESDDQALCVLYIRVQS